MGLKANKILLLLVNGSGHHNIELKTWRRGNFIVLGHLNKSADRHVAPLGHIILIPSQLVFALSA